MVTSLRPSTRAKFKTDPDAPRFDPDEIRRIVKLGMQRGLIRAPENDGTPAAQQIDKSGADAARLLQESGEILRSQWIDVTPAKAALWLENNFRNRPLSDDTVRAYARDMVAGQWVATHQGIAFNDRDELIDGQHRLRAIVLSGVTARMMVTFGLPSLIDGKEMTTMDAVDRGRPRSVADQLKIQHGFREGGTIAAICAAVASICCGERTRRLSVGQTLAVFRAYEPTILWLLPHRSKLPGLRNAGLLAGFVFALATEKGEGAIAGMFMAFNKCEGLKEKSAMAHLRAFVTSDEAKLFTPTLNRGLAELVMQAIHLELRGKPIAKLELSLDGVAHFRALQKERVEKIAGLFALPAGRN